MIQQEREFIEEANIYRKGAVHCLTYTITMKTDQVNTLEVDEIKPIIPGMGLICTPRSLSITFERNQMNKKEKEKIIRISHRKTAMEKAN